MKRSLLTRALVVAGVTLICVYALIGLPFSKEAAIANWHRSIRLGADLQGGMQLVLEVAWREAWTDPGVPDKDFRDRVMRQTREVIQKKINGLGVSEATVQFAGTPGAEDRLLVELPGVDDPERVKRVLNTAAVLEWLDVRGGPFESKEEAYAKNNGMLPLGTQLLSFGTGQAPSGPWYLLARLPVVRGTDLRDARLTQSERGWATSFVLSQEAARRF